MLWGFVGIAAAWAVSWSLLAVLLAVTLGAVGIGPFAAGDGIALLLVGIVGFTLGLIGGSFFALILTFAERRRALGDMRVTRVASWGAVAGVIVPFGFWALVDPLRTVEPAPPVLGEVVLLCVGFSALGAISAAGIRVAVRVSKRLR